MVATYQGFAIAEALSDTDDVLAEQGISTAQDAAVEPDALLTGAGVAPMLDKAQTDTQFFRLVSTLVMDAGRTALAVDRATRPAVTGVVRAITTPCCARCAVLAGRVYRFDEAFQRHPRCDCIPIGTTLALGRELATDPMELFRSGQIRSTRTNAQGQTVSVPGLSRADTKALNNGADISQVVNVRRKGAGLVEGSSVLVRAGRPTPEFIIRTASDRDERLTLLRRFGYIT